MTLYNVVDAKGIATAVLNQWALDGFTNPDNRAAMDIYAKVLGTTGEAFKRKCIKKAANAFYRDSHSQKPPSSDE